MDCIAERLVSLLGLAAICLFADVYYCDVYVYALVIAGFKSS